MLKTDKQPSIDIQKKMARFFIGENRLEEALGICLDILRVEPDEPEVLNMIGELYLATGNARTAEKVFCSVLNRLPDEEGIISSIKVAANTRSNFKEESIPTSPGAIKRLLQNLTSREQPVSEEELLKAAQLLNVIVNSPSPAVEVAQHLEEIDNLLPALLDLNIQQAKNDGHPDLAAGLNNLKTNITLQKCIFSTSLKNPGIADLEETDASEPFSGRVGIFQPDQNAAESVDRMKLLKSALLSNGNYFDEATDLDGYPDVAVFSNAFLNANLMEKMVKLSAARVPIILDIDQSYDHNLSPEPETNSNNLTSQAFDRAYVSSLILADLVSVTSEPFAERIRLSGYPAMTIPSGWSIINSYWAEKASSTSATLQMGWFGSTGNLDDLALIRRPLIRLLNEFDDKLKIVVVGNQDAYRMFDHVPESLKTFVPYLTSDELPYIINQMDMILMPLRKTLVNEMRSDEMLMYAGVKKIPWVASSFPVSQSWEKGGLICSTLEEWHTSLRCLILDKELRQTLGEEGFRKAAKREMLVHLRQWNRAFSLIRSGREDGTISRLFAGNRKGRL